MHPIRTEEATGTYAAPNGLESVVGGLPFWRETDPDGLPVVRSVWALDPDEKEAVALGGNVLVGIVGEPIPPISLVVLSPIDVPAFGMEALADDLMQRAHDEFFSDVDPERHDGGLVAPVVLTLVLALAAILLLAGFAIGRLTG